MDVVSAVSGYLSKMVSSGDQAPEALPAKMKILLLDRETVRVYSFAVSYLFTDYPQVAIVSTAITQSALLNHEVYLVE